MVPEQVYRRHRFRVYPTPRQAHVIEEWSRACVRVWNDALEQRQRLYRDHTAVEGPDGVWRLRHDRSRGGVTLSSGRSGAGAWVPGLPRRAAIVDHRGDPVQGQVRQLADARAELPWLAAVPAQVTNSVLYRLDKAYQASWRRLRAGKPAGFPRFRASRNIALSLPSFSQTHRLISSPEGSRIMWLGIGGARGGESIGRLRCRTDIPLEGCDLGELTLWERNGRWWGSIVLRTPAAIPPEWEGEPRICGVNRGVVHLLTLDDGTHLPAIQLPEGELRRLKHLERRAARQHLTTNRPNMDRAGRMLPGRRRVTSNRERATRQQIARIRERHANIRREQLSLAANWLLEHHEVVCIERLEIGLMMRRERHDGGLPAARMRDLHRRIGEQAWGELARMLTYRAVERGRIVIEVDPRHISQTCPECGVLTKQRIGSRVFGCGSCGHAEDVDVVAARNVRMRGEAMLAGERAAQQLSDTVDA